MKRFYTVLLSASLMLFSLTPMGMSADYNFKKITPEIDQALKNRQARYSQLQNLKKEGLLGENNKGYVTDLKSNASASSLAEAENRDRRIVYEALAEQNALGRTGLLEVQKAFAEVQQEKAASGDMVQSPSGNWEKK